MGPIARVHLESTVFSSSRQCSSTMSGAMSKSLIAVSLLLTVRRAAWQEKRRSSGPVEEFFCIHKRRTNKDKEIIRTDAIVLSKMISEHIFHDSKQVVEPEVWGNVFMELVSPENEKFGSLNDHHRRMTYFAE